MASTTTLTAAKALEILGESVVSGTVNGSGHLILTRENGTTFDAGDVTLINAAETAVAIAAHAALDEGIHGLTGVGNDVVGTTKVQTLSGKTLTSPVITGLRQKWLLQKAGDTARTNNTFTDDPHLLFAAEANKTYEIDYYLRVVTAGTGGGFRFGINAPAAAVLNMVEYVLPASDTITGGISAGENNHASIVGSAMLPALNSQISGIINTAAAATYTMKITALVTLGATPGNIALTWAQHVTDADATTVKQGSFMIAERIV